MSIEQIRTITIPVEDQDSAKAFYVDTLGFHERLDLSMGENRWLEVELPDSGTGIVLHQLMSGMSPGSSHGVILHSNAIDDDVARLRAAGVEADGPQDMPWGRQATLADPQGNEFVLSAAATG